MPHADSLILTLVGGFVLAFVLGMLANRLKLSPLVGYLVAGVIVGPHTAGFVADTELAPQLAEIGVILLMFGVGLHFSPKDLMQVRKVAIPGALVQIASATIMGWALGRFALGMSDVEGLLMGFALSVASTVVLMRALEERRQNKGEIGRIAVGWLIVEDLVIVIALVMLPMIIMPAGQTIDGGALALNIGWTLLKVAVFVLVMLYVGGKALPWLLVRIAHTKSRELFTLGVLSIALGIAWVAYYLFHSFALGAFLAGLVLNGTPLGHNAAERSLPLRDAFAVLFFVSVGMLFDPLVLLAEPLRVLAVVAIIILGKGLAAAVLVLTLRYPLNTALTVAASLAQIGEFSFILAGLGLSLGLMPAEGMSLVLAAALISIALNPLIFATSQPIQRWVLARSDFARRLESRDDPFAELPMSTERRYLAGQVVLVGFGRVGRRIAQALEANSIPYVVAEQNRELVEDLRKQGKAAVYGNATDPAVLIQAHIAEAALLVVATPDPLNVRQMVDTARTLNPGIEIVLRTHSDEESRMLRKENMGMVFFGEEELAKGMTHYVVERFGPQPGNSRH